MKAEIKTLWLDALRSGKYQQGVGVLQLHTKQEFCCLGVLCELAVRAGVAFVLDHAGNGSLYSDSADPAAGHQSREQLPNGVAIWAGLENNPQVDHIVDDYVRTETLAEINDNGYDFEHIADLIEEQL